MSIYNEIINWAANKPDFVKDALRRITSTPIISSTDIDDLTDLLKKQVGFQGITKVAVPISNAHIPTATSPSTDVARLLSIESPININALYSRAKIEFEASGLTVVYGNNGSGKSGYSKILKKLCWSRHKNVDLKTNVHTNDQTPQSVTIRYSIGTNNYSYNWSNSKPINQNLNTVFVFDTDCANIYLNSENVTEYRPVGIDLLERLIVVFKEIEVKINQEKGLLITQKPVLEQNRFLNTQIYKWYQGIETINDSAIQTKLQFTQKEANRKSQLTKLLNSSNPVLQKKELEQKKQRYQVAITEIQNSLKLFSDLAIQKVIEIKNDYVSKYEAYLIAQNNIKGDFPLNGIGSDTWRVLWNAAKEFAIKEVHPLHEHFPSDISAEFCVFCQQKLDPDASERLLKFNLFINDKTSNEFDSVSQKLQQVISNISSINFPKIQILDELENDIPGFKQNFIPLEQDFNNRKYQILAYLEPSNRSTLASFTKILDVITPIQGQINHINSSLNDLNTLITARVELEIELLELEGLEILFANKTQILTYHKELVLKNYLDKCLSQLNTAAISRKIGEILDSSAITVQQQEFLAHVMKLNPELASKVSLSKTRTSGGKTYHRVGFNATKEALLNVLSEGEQKVIALANFLSECTVDNRINSIVFDDPVTSLDQDYREAIASTLVDLSFNRQVIVLTHDLYFLRLLLELHTSKFGLECKICGLQSKKGISGYNSDEIPYLAKNTQERIDSIRKILTQIKGLSPTAQGQIEVLLDSGRKKFRMLIERAVEELLANKAIERFSKNIHVKSGNLSSFVIVEHADIQFLLALFGKYSITEHDGGISTLPQLPDETAIESDLNDFATWKNDFNSRLKAFKTTNGYK